VYAVVQVSCVCSGTGELCVFVNEKASRANGNAQAAIACVTACACVCVCVCVRVCTLVSPSPCYLQTHKKHWPVACS
jgi:hypothetical protein